MKTTKPSQRVKVPAAAQVKKSSGRGKTSSPPKTPAVIKLGSGPDRIIFYGLLIIWLAILGFALLTLVQPAWLRDLSKKGRKVEGKEFTDKGNALMYEANATNSKALFGRAADMYEKALLRDTGSVEAMNNLATAYLNLGRYAESLALYNKLLELDTIHRAVVYSNLGDYYERQQDPVNALACFEKAARNDAYNAYPWRKYGLFLLRNGRMAEAETALLHALATDRMFSAYYCNGLVKSYRDAVIQANDTTVRLLGKKLQDPHIAADTARFDYVSFQQVRRQNPRAGFNLLYLGDVYSAMGNREKALAFYTACESEYPRLAGEARARSAKL